MSMTELDAIRYAEERAERECISMRVFCVDETELYYVLPIDADQPEDSRLVYEVAK